MKMKQSEVINKLGGACQVMEMTGIPQTTVSSYNTGARMMSKGTLALFKILLIQQDKASFNSMLDEMKTINIER